MASPIPRREVSLTSGSLMTSIELFQAMQFWWCGCISTYHLVMTNIAMENPRTKWRLQEGKIIYFILFLWAMASMAMLVITRGYDFEFDGFWMLLVFGVFSIEIKSAFRIKETAERFLANVLGRSHLHCSPLCGGSLNYRYHIMNSFLFQLNQSHPICFCVCPFVHVFKLALPMILIPVLTRDGSTHARAKRYVA